MISICISTIPPPQKRNEPPLSAYLAISNRKVQIFWILRRNQISWPKKEEEKRAAGDKFKDTIYWIVFSTNKNSKGGGGGHVHSCPPP